jgi:hypothetical protein
MSYKHGPGVLNSSASSQMPTDVGFLLRFTATFRQCPTGRGVNGTDIIRPFDRPKRLIIRLDSFFRYPQNIRISDSNSDSTFRISDTDMI